MTPILEQNTSGYKPESPGAPWFMGLDFHYSKFQLGDQKTAADAQSAPSMLHTLTWYLFIHREGTVNISSFN